MQVELKSSLSAEKRREIAEELRAFEEVIQDGRNEFRARGEKDKLEKFMAKHADEIRSGLIAAPGSLIQTRGGTQYEVASDGSWRKKA